MFYHLCVLSLNHIAAGFSFFRVSHFKAAVGFHVQFAKFFYSVNIELIVDASRFIAAAYIVIFAQ